MFGITLEEIDAKQREGWAVYYLTRSIVQLERGTIRRKYYLVEN